MTLRPPDRPVGKRRQAAVFMAEGLGASYARHQQTVDRPAGESGAMIDLVSAQTYNKRAEGSWGVLFFAHKVPPFCEASRSPQQAPGKRRMAVFCWQYAASKTPRRLVQQSV